MFDKILFDRNAFDRSVSSDGIKASYIGQSDQRLNLMMVVPVVINFKSQGTAGSRMLLEQRFREILSSQGDLNNPQIVLKLAIGASLESNGGLNPSLTVKTPFSEILSGDGGLTANERLYFHQYIDAPISGAGEFTPRPVIKFDMSGSANGSGEMDAPGYANQLPLSGNYIGESSFILRRLGVANENAIELIGIDFKPGDTITIDTDLLQVLFGSTEDVSAVTTESVFFEINPGENEIIVDADVDSQLNVTVIWQNRWL